MNGEARGTIVYDYYVFDIPAFQKLNEVFNLKLAVRMRCATLSADHIVKIFLVFL
jgi:hypothetical protein